MNEFNLSKNGRNLKDNTIFHSEKYYIEHDVKEFIRLLKEEMLEWIQEDEEKQVAIKIIDKLAGEALTKCKK